VLAARLARRLIVAGVTLIGITVVTFAAFELLPGDPLASRLGPDAAGRATAQAREALTRELGLDRPAWERYASWVSDLARGELGRSRRTGRPVSEEIRARVGATLELNLAALLLVVGAGLPIGWWMASRPDTALDRLGGLTLLVAYAVPTFWLAVVLQNALAVRWPVLPLYGRGSIAEHGVAGWLAHLALPAGCLALHQLAFYTRLTRNATLESLGSPHALTARAAGLGPVRVLFRHGVRPALVPLVTWLGLAVPSLVTGSVLIETIFAWPGIGRLLVEAIQGRDAPVVLGLTVLVGVLTVAGSLAADAAAAAVDPRPVDAREGRP
jgi:ABC-type dipeptide/oligopeptide/nickel transport system permease component